MMSWVMRSPSRSKDFSSSASPERSGSSASCSRRSSPERRMLLPAFSTSVTRMGSAERRKMPIRGAYGGRLGSCRALHDFFTSRSRVCNSFTGAGKARYGAVAVHQDSASTLYAGELEIRLGEGLVLATGRALTLSVREFELLVAPARRAGAIITREELYDTVWGGDLRP